MSPLPKTYGIASVALIIESRISCNYWKIMSILWSNKKFNDDGDFSTTTYIDGFFVIMKLS